MSATTLLTGATGFLGMETLARLIERDREPIAVLVRAEDEQGAARRLSRVLGLLYDDPPPAAERIRAVRGDLLEPGLGLSSEDRRWLVESVGTIVHCAAAISFDLPVAQAREVNVEGTLRVLELGREIAAAGHLRRLLHVSTAYVGGSHAGVFGECDLDLGQSFRNTYELSKNEAERRLRAGDDLPIVIARPSMVVGHALSGWTPVFNVVYWPIRAFERGLLTEVPARRDSVVDFVPVDYVAAAILALLDNEDAHGTYNLVAGPGALSAGEMLELLDSLPELSSSRRTAVRLVEPRGGAELPPGAETLAPYFDVRCRFDDDRARALLTRAGVAKPAPADYMRQLIAYAQDSRWGKRPVSRQGSLRRAAAASPDL